MRPWSSLAEIIADPLLVVDAQGRIFFANSAAEAWWGSSPVGRTLIAATHQLALMDLVESVRASKALAEAEYRIRSASERWVRVRASPVPKKWGGGVALVFTDRTELVHLRTVRTEFVANVSHELRTPLASIRALAETLSDGALADVDAAPRFLTTIVREVDRLVRLSEDLLLLARSEASEQDREVFDLRGVQVDVVERLEPTAARRHVRLESEFDAEPVWVSGDRMGIDQVVFNLVDNGIKYTPEGGIVRCGSSRIDGRACLFVADTGIGMLSEDLPRIFERFWRADRARKFPGEGGTATGGTGLGLSIVKHIVEAHRGSIDVRSELGKGAEFTVCLPWSDPSQSTDPAPAADE